MAEDLVGGLAALFGSGGNGNLMTGGMTPGLNIPPNTEMSPAAFTPGFPATVAPAPATGGGGMFSNGNILGMRPEQFASIFGQLANAIGGGKTMGARMGQVAAQLGIAQMQQALAKNQQSSYMKSLQEILKAAGDNPKGVATLGHLSTLFGKASTGAAKPSLLTDIGLGNINQDLSGEG